jgi:hypothetical protein
VGNERIKTTKKQINKQLQMPVSADVRRRRAQYAKRKKINALVTGNNSLRIALRSLDNKAQQMLSDRLHFIDKLGKGYVSTAFKGLSQHGGTSSSNKTSPGNDEQVPEVDEENDYGIQAFQGINLEGIAPQIRGSGRYRGVIRAKGYNRNDDLKRIAALTNAGHQAVPGSTGKLYRPPKKEISFRRANHLEPFRNSVFISSRSIKDIDRSNQNENINNNSNKRPFTAPLGIRTSKHNALPRRLSSRQRPATNPNSSSSSSSSSSSIEKNSKLLLSNPSWDGLFAKQSSRPGTASTGITSISTSSRPCTAGATSTYKVRYPAVHGPNSRFMRSRGSQHSRGSQKNRSPEYNQWPEVLVVSRPGTAEHLERARKRRDRKLRPSTGPAMRKRASNHIQRPSTSSDRKVKHWENKYMIQKRSDANDDYQAIIERLAATRFRCDLVAS